MPFAEQAVARLAANALDHVQDHTDRDVASQKTLNDLAGHCRIPLLIVYAVPISSTSDENVPRQIW
jgi:hypothetical protein